MKTKTLTVLKTAKGSCLCGCCGLCCKGAGVTSVKKVAATAT